MSANIDDRNNRYYVRYLREICPIHMYKYFTLLVCFYDYFLNGLPGKVIKLLVIDKYELKSKRLNVVIQIKLVVRLILIQAIKELIIQFITKHLYFYVIVMHNYIHM